jgi:Zn-finger nucleic acid-binding protein
MKCPVCSELLVMTDRSGVEIDYCPKCRGVWLDRGELDKIIEKSLPLNRNNSPEDRNKYRDHDHREYKEPYYGKKRKESFLEDLFDF